jgi:hypothetical protein
MFATVAEDLRRILSRGIERFSGQCGLTFFVTDFGAVFNAGGCWATSGLPLAS